MLVLIKQKNKTLLAMKKVMIFGVLIAGIYLASCTQNNVSPTPATTTTASSARAAASDPTATKGGPKDTIAVKDLPAVIVAYIKATYPTAVIEHAGKTATGGYIVIIDVAGLDKGLTFDAAGKFVAEAAKGSCGPKGAGGPKTGEAPKSGGEAPKDTTKHDGPKPNGPKTGEAPRDTTKHDGPKQGGKPPKGSKG